MRHSRIIFGALAPVVIAALLLTPAALAAAPTFEERVAAQAAIEKVYWQERTWAAAAERPPFASAVPTALLEDKVRDYLRKSDALERVWKRPLTAGQLQAELLRMTEQSRAPQVLEKLFAALGYDTGLIAETLVRQKLVERLARNWYEADPKVHQDVRAEAEQSLAASSSAEDWVAQGALLVSSIARREGADRPHGAAKIVEVLDATQWSTLETQLSRRLGRELPVGVWSGLHEDRDAFEVVSITGKSPTQVEIASVRWPKQDFDAWWGEQASSMSISIDAPSSDYVALPLEVGGCASGSWESLTSVPTGRLGGTATWTGSEMIVWGGGYGLNSSSVAIDRGARYDPATDTWVPMTNAGAPAARRDHVAVWTGSELIVWGGAESGEFSMSLASGGRYDPLTDSWQPISSVGAPESRERHTGVWTGDELIVWGGLRDDGTESLVGTGGRYDPAGDSWTSMSTAGAPSARQRHSMVWTGSEAIVWGGLSDTGEQDTGGRYDPAGDSWSSTPVIGGVTPVARYHHTAVWTGSEMVVWGGWGAGYDKNSGGRYNPATNTWSRTTPFGAPEERRQHTAVWTGSEMIVWGGEHIGTELNNGRRYDPFSDSWMMMNMFGPSARSIHTAVWTGSEMIVWGGGKKSGELAMTYLDTGARYDPISDSWVATAASGGPIRRAYHTAVWTGSEMIVWGGFYYGGDYFDDGGRYEPATSTWTPTSTVNAPEGRRNHTAVWTGSDMIVWGGYSVGTSVKWHGTGKSYDPVSNLWTPMTTANLPMARTKHTAVWTGSKMIIWGGGGGGGLVGQGESYDPVTDTWDEISMTGQPPMASEHTALWTGSRMLVWGGGSSNSAKNTGGLYDPATDSWVLTSMVDVPSTRKAHSAVWTGGEMIVWGGRTVWDLRGDGARFDPSSNVWTPISSVGAPSPRAYHTAVWTGSNMVVYGGREDVSVDEIGDGGVYNPTADTWSPTSTLHQPTNRAEHTAVWTDSDVLVFGGEEYPGTFWADGGRFCVRDADADGSMDDLDCNSGDANTWGSPGQARGLALSGVGSTELTWEAPEQPGSTALVYDVLRSTFAGNFAAADCVVADVEGVQAVDGAMPASGQVLHYLVVAENGCGAASGAGSDGTPRSMPACD